MTAFFIAQVQVKDPEKLSQYASQVGETMAPFGGEAVARGQFREALSGTASPHHIAAIFRFPDMDTLLAWYNSDAYQALIPIRDAGADITITTYVVPD